MRFLALFLLALLTPLASHAAPDPFADGATLAAEGDTLGAALAFAEAARAGAGAAAHFNAGTLFLGAGMAGPARYHLEAAYRLDPGAPDVQRNLRLVREAVGEAPPSAGAQLWHGLRGTLGTGGLVALALALYGAAFGVGAGAWVSSGPRQRVLRRAALVLAPLALLAVALAATALVSDLRPAAVVVAEAPVPLRAAPGAGAPLGEVPPGLHVHAGREAEGWRRVALPGGGRGWVPARALATL